MKRIFFCVIFISFFAYPQTKVNLDHTDIYDKSYVDEDSLFAQYKGDSIYNIKFRKAEEKVKELIENYHAAGLSVAIIKDGNLIYTKGFGYRDYEKKISVNTHTIFGIGSITKSFTASLLGILESKGKLTLKDSPIKYLPELKFYTKEMDAKIQLHHMLTHTTGISNISSESSAILFVTDSIKELLPRLAHLKPSASVGERLMYNNYIYTLLGMVGAEVTGQSWDENLESMIFRPLKMERTFSSYQQASSFNSNVSYGYAVDSIQPVRVLPEIVPTRAPAGAIFSTAEDMSKWLQVFMNKGKANHKQVIPADYIPKAIQPYTLFSGNENDSASIVTHYGYGWITRNFKGLKRVEHSGGVSGYGSNAVFFPEKNLGIVVLTNQTSSSLSYAVTDVFVNELLQIDDTLPEINYSQVHKITNPNTPTVINQKRKPSHALKAFTGKYQHPGYGELSIVLHDQTLYADFPLTRFRLTHREHNIFNDHFAEEIPLLMWNFMQFNFLEDTHGVINSLSLNFDSAPVIFKRIHKP